MEFIEEFNEAEKLKIKDEFKRMGDTIYFDLSGTSLYGESQIKETCEVLTSNLIINPHTSKLTGDICDQVRLRVLKHFNADPNEYTLIFTAGCTASLKLVGESFQFSDNGAFYYLTDSHTSVLGLREIVTTKRIIPLTRTTLCDDEIESEGKSLIAFAAQCNFNGYKFPLKNIQKFHQNENNYVLLDAAAFIASNLLDLSIYKPDYVALSFYKLFGFPTGVGALLVSKRGAENLKKKYYGGGTIKIALTRTNWHEKRDFLQQRFEDGTINFLGVVSLQTSFKFLENLIGPNFIQRISRQAFNLGKYFYDNMKKLRHFNDQPVVVFYNATNFDEIRTQGGLVIFNLKRFDGSFVGYAEFLSIATLHNIIIRTGCLCNPGSCQTYLNLTTEDIMKQYSAGHICSDENDLVDGLPTGAIRVSFGYYNTKQEVDKFLELVEQCYVQKVPKVDKSLILPTKVISSQPRLKSIRIYPIKSCGSMIIKDKWKLTKKGLKYDREWMIINGGNGTSLTQKNEPKMCLIQPLIDETNNVLCLNFPHADSIKIPLNNENEKQFEAIICETKVCGERINGFDCGDEVAKWLSNVLLIENLRLIKQANESERKKGTIALANQAQFLLISEPSVQWLMNQVESWDYEQNVDNIVERFRGNFIIENADPFVENKWSKLKIGDRNHFEVEGPCTRCQMICIDQSTGEKTTEPLRTIGRIFNGKTRFGIYLKMSNNSSVIHCGDKIALE